VQHQFDHACKIAQDHQMAGRRAEAFAIWRELACKFPEQPMPFYALGMMCVEDDQDHIAIGMLQYAASINPRDAWTWANLGSVMKRQEHRDKAAVCYRKALEIEPKNQLALTGLAGCYVNAGNPAPGIVYARRALEIDGPHKPNARNDLALMLLEMGEWEEGFRHYRHRSDLAIYHVRDFGDVPRWDGQKVGTLALHAEQGLGDEILFASCLADVLPLADRIVAECNERVLPLLRRSFPSIIWYGTHDELMDREANGIKAWERLGDLSYLFRGSPQACPGIPYLRADYAKIRGYRARLEAMREGPYIGFAWLGGTGPTHRIERRAPREHWASLINNAPGVKISLQYGEDGARHARKMNLHHWQGVIDDLDETAALIMALDCVVSSPQTVIHMAGALGKRCLVALSSKPAWRYQLSGPMPWYKSVELVRQHEEDWGPVFFNIGERLANLRQLQAAE